MYMHRIKDTIYEKKEEKRAFNENIQHDILEENMPLICKTTQHLDVREHPLDSGNKLPIKMFLPTCVSTLLPYQRQCNRNQWMLQPHCKPNTISSITEITDKLYEPNIWSIVNRYYIENKIQSIKNHNIDFKMLNEIVSLTITNIDGSSYNFLIEKNTLNTLVITALTKTKIQEEALKPYVDEDNFMPQYTVSNVFRHWYIRNIAHGFILNNMLRNNKINVLTIVSWAGNILKLVVIKNSSNNRFILNFIFRLPLDDESIACCCYLSFCNFKYATKDDSIFTSSRVDGKVFKDELNVNMSLIRIANKTNKEVEINTERENRLISLSNSKINGENCQCMDNKISLPGRCSDFYNNKASFMAYILKCRCLNGELLNLNLAEKYLKNIFEVMFPPTFTKTFLSDLGTSLAYTFFSSVL